MTQSNDERSELVRTNVNLRIEPKEIVKEERDESLSAACRLGTRLVARGEAIVEAETKNEIAREQLDDTLEAIESVQSDLLNRGKSSGAVSIEQVEDALAELMQKREQAVEDTNKERLQQAQSQVASRESDPESVSVGAEMSPVEAAEAMVSGSEHDDTKLPDRALKEGPDHIGVQHHAEKCDMDPADFFQFLVENCADVPVSSKFSSDPDTVGEWMDENAALHGYEFWNTGAETERRHRTAVTDGGERR